MSGKPLMSTVFHEQNAGLDITTENADTDQKADEAEGFKFLFMGGAQGIRNTRGHGPDLQTDEQEAREMLALASLLMRRLDRAEIGCRNQSSNGHYRICREASVARRRASETVRRLRSLSTVVRQPTRVGTGR